MLFDHLLFIYVLKEYVPKDTPLLHTQLCKRSTFALSFANILLDFITTTPPPPPPAAQSFCQTHQKVWPSRLFLYLRSLLPSPHIIIIIINCFTFLASKSTTPSSCYLLLFLLQLWYTSPFVYQIFSQSVVVFLLLLLVLVVSSPFLTFIISTS